MTAPRKDPRNFGTQLAEEKQAELPLRPDIISASGRFSVVMAERVFLKLLRQEITRLCDPANETDLRRFFSHFFDPMVTKDERDSYVSNFQRNPPTTVLGYPRTTTRLPAFAVILEQDTEVDKPLGTYLGQTGAEEVRDEAEEYIGTMFEQTYGVYVYAEHPDACIYLYHFAKAVFLGAYNVLHACGIIDPSYSGNEMTPEETYLPENMFVRRLGVQFRSLATVPAILSPDPKDVRTGVWASDLVVSGVRWGVTADGEDFSEK